MEVAEGLGKGRKVMGRVGRRVRKLSEKDEGG